MPSVLDQVRGVLERAPHLRLAYVFGSTVSGVPRKGSDVDVGVLWSTRPSLEDLAAVVGELRLATGRTVDLVDLGTAPPPLLLRQVIIEGRSVVVRDEDERIAFETRALARYMDTAHLRRVQAAALHEWAEGYRAGRR